MSVIPIAFAGDRDISVWVLRYLLQQGVQPLALLVSDVERASHADELIKLCPLLPRERILRGTEFRESGGRELLRSLDLSYVIGIHFPYLVPKSVLNIPRVGVLNLHPAYLPYNRGWHTPTWAILEQKPIGATLHFMDEGVDTGDIVHQERLEVRPEDTANSLYQRLKQLEYDVFVEAWPHIADGSYQRHPQSPNEGTSHRRAELFEDHVQKIELDQPTTARIVIRQLRALTTSKIAEAAYFDEHDKRYRVQIVIEEDRDDTQ